MKYFLIKICLLQQIFIYITQCVQEKSKQQTIQQAFSDPESYWTGSCLDESALQSPVNIDGPFTFMSVNFDFQFRKILKSKGFISNKGKEVRIDGDFGDLVHNDISYTSYTMNFKCPSEHSVGSQQMFFPLEIQVYFISGQGERLNLSFFFSYDETETDNQFLKKLGFGRGVLQHLLEGQSFEIPETFSLQEIVAQKQKYFIYKGSETKPPCHPTTWFIAYENLKLSQNQIDDFPKSVLYEGRSVQPLKQEIFINFNPNDEQNDQDNNEELNQSLKDNSSMATLNKNSFEIIGDSTLYDAFIYGHESRIIQKVIKNEDYLVIQKINSQDLNLQADIDDTQVLVDQDFVDSIIQDLVQPQQQQNTVNNDKQQENQQKQNSNNNNQQENQQKEENINFSQLQNNSNKNNNQNQNNNDKKAYNSEGQWDGIPIIDTTEWPELCNQGQQQSPIWIDLNKIQQNQEMDIIKINYNKINKNTQLTNSELKFSLKGSFGTLEFKNQIYKAKEINIHTPSEHTIGNNQIRTDMEIQISHISSNGEQLNLAIFLTVSNENEPNKFFESLDIKDQNHFTILPKNTKITLNQKISLQQIFPESLKDTENIEHYIHYQGSLTRPPCDENVKWIIARTRGTLTQKQLENYQKMVSRSEDVRGLQPINDRIIQFY